jgi:hypothetical protein
MGRQCCTCGRACGRWRIPRKAEQVMATSEQLKALSIIVVALRSAVAWKPVGLDQHLPDRGQGATWPKSRCRANDAPSPRERDKGERGAAWAGRALKSGLPFVFLPPVSRRLDSPHRKEVTVASSPNGKRAGCPSRNWSGLYPVAGAW